ISFFDAAMASKGFDPNDSTRRQQVIFEYSPAAKQLLGIQDKPDVPLPEIFSMAGFTLYEQSKINEAYSYFIRCISHEYNLGESYYMAGLCLLSYGKKDKACELFW